MFFSCKMVLDKKYDFFKLKTNLDKFILKNEVEEVEDVIIEVKEIKILKDYDYEENTEYAINLLIEHLGEEDMDFFIQEGYLLNLLDFKLYIENKSIPINEIMYLETLTEGEVNNLIKDIFNSKDYGDKLLIGTKDFTVKDKFYNYKNNKDYNKCLLKDYLIENNISFILCNGFSSIDNLLFDLVVEIKEELLNINIVLLLPYRNFGEKTNKYELDLRKNKADYIMYTDEFKECSINFCKIGEYHKLKFSKNKLYLLNLNINHFLDNIEGIKLI